MSLLSQFPVPLLGALLLAACASPPRDRVWVDKQLQDRLGAGLSEDILSPKVQNVTEPLDERRAVALALENSPKFRADMAQLRTATANFAEATRIENPSVSFLAPIGVINAAATVTMPLMSVARLPRRKKIASRELEAVSESLVQTGLNLARDVRLAHIECILTQEQVEILKRLGSTADGFSKLADLRAETGDVSAVEAEAVRADARMVAERAELAWEQHQVAVARLQLLMGLDPIQQVDVVSRLPLPEGDLALPALLRIAKASRPDVRAAKFRLEAALARAGLEKSQITEISAVADAQWNDSQGGVRVGGVAKLPLFNQNQGGKGRAKAEVEASLERIDSVRQQVSFEVLQASIGLRRARESNKSYERLVLQPLTLAIKSAQERYELGDESYVLVLDALRRLGTAQLRGVELKAEAQRSYAELERALGARLDLLDMKAEP